MKWVFVLALFTNSLGVIEAVIYELTDDEYHKMPPTVFLDPYDRCLRQPDAVYCSAYFVYVADQHSPLLHQMQEYSEKTRTNYNHTRAFLGTCVSTNCKHLMNNSSNLEMTLEACLNETIYEKYELKVRLIDRDILHCISKDGSINDNKIDTTDVAIGIVVIVFVLLNIVGSFSDNKCSKDSKNGVVPQILLCFSLSRNWKSLTSVNDVQEPRIDRLKAIHGIRAISMSIVILAHTLLPMNVMAKNPQFVEKTYSSYVVHMFRNGTLIMQTFFIMSSFLLIYNLQISAEKKSVTWKQLLLKFIKRWFRLTPPYAFVLALTVTWLRHMGNGPFWQKFVLLEFNHCRKYWWMNLLYINNCIDGSLCMQHTWYLAADIQLYAVGLLVFLLGRDLEVRKKLLGGLFLLGLVMPALHTYFQDLDGNLVVTPTTVINLFVTDPTYNHVYRRGHTNLSGYVVGLSLGYLVYHLQKNGFDAGKYKKWRPIFWSLWPFGCVILACQKVFYESPRIGIEYRVLGAILARPLFAVCIAALLLGFFVQLESVYRGIVEWGGWKPLSRVSYSAYLLHVAFIRTWTGNSTDGFYLSVHKLIELANWMTVVTWLGAIVFWLTVEAPLGRVTKMLLAPRNSNAQKDS